MVLLAFLFLYSNATLAQAGRQDINLNANWYTIASPDGKPMQDLQNAVINNKWTKVNVPHNWDAYHGYRRLLHGNRHGDSWYRKTFTSKSSKSGKRFFLFFEGVGSYATVFLNGKKVGEHAGGRTTFTIDVTDYIKTGGEQNQLSVRAYHPANIQDLPWVCGGCSDERGFSEGSQPMGIFRPVHLIITNEVRIEPFGIHAWSDSTVSTSSAKINTSTTLKNYGKVVRTIDISHQLLDANKAVVATAYQSLLIKPGETIDFKHAFDGFKDIRLWSPDDPYLYEIKSTVFFNRTVLDEVTTSFGIRSIRWLHTSPNTTNQFLLNGKPVFINGIAEYEHLLGGSHAFSNEQIAARAKMIKASGFNAFRDAHQPHNLYYQQFWDSMGILSWTQMSAHVWYDNKSFRENFKTLLKEWVIERRNSPSIILWGLQNESKLPKDFAEECVALIRSLDPTCSSQRLVTSCNGGEGTDWNVPQNWTGTYGGDPNTYTEDLKKQILVGEYGAWRTIDLHSDNKNEQPGTYSEEKMAALMETKVRLAESARDSVAGHFAWLLTSHDNPGRVQGGEGYRALDRIGPVNYKGLLTPWEEPLDVFYMYRSNYVSKVTAPMVYIVSHTWPGRWTAPGIKDNVAVYSNCDEVELYNSLTGNSLGKKKRGTVGTHLVWDSVNIRYNVLYAVGYVNGNPVAKDTLMLEYLPEAPGFGNLYSKVTTVTEPQPNYNYIYRLNCGGPDYKDEYGFTWNADRSATGSTGSRTTSWTGDFPGMPTNFASQRRTNNPIKGTRDWPLFQTFRYGREKLSYNLPVQDGDYLVELYFAEPWWGVGGGIDCSGFRLFDVAVNDKIVLQNLDIWKEAGVNSALKKTFLVKVKGQQIKISFPNVAAGQAIISAIAIASLNKNLKWVPAPASIIQNIQWLTATAQPHVLNAWLDNGDTQFLNSKKTFVSLPPELFSADWISLHEKTTGQVQFKLGAAADLYVSGYPSSGMMLKGFEDTKTFITNSAGERHTLYKKRLAKNAAVILTTDSLSGIFVLPASGMQPAYDLKPVTAYRPATAKATRGVKNELLNEKETLRFMEDNQTVSWAVNIGAADIYSMTIRYSNPTNKLGSAFIELVMVDGTILKKEQIEFNISREGKWSYNTTNTGTMINAGNYTIRITAKNAVGIGISGLDIQ